MKFRMNHYQDQFNFIRTVSKFGIYQKLEFANDFTKQKNNLFNYNKLNSKNFDVKYNFQKLQYGEQYSGNIKDFDGKISLNKTTFQAYQSILSNKDTKGLSINRIIPSNKSRWWFQIGNRIQIRKNKGVSQPVDSQQSEVWTIKRVSCI